MVQVCFNDGEDGGSCGGRGGGLSSSSSLRFSSALFSSVSVSSFCFSRGCCRLGGKWQLAVMLVAVAVAGKPDDSSGFLLLLHRAEAQVAAFSSMVQQREEDDELRKADYGVSNAVVFVLLVALVSRQPAVVALPLLLCHCFFSLFLSPCFSPNNSLSLSLDFSFFSLLPSLFCLVFPLSLSHLSSVPSPKVLPPFVPLFLKKSSPPPPASCALPCIYRQPGERHHTLSKCRAWWREMAPVQPLQGMVFFSSWWGYGLCPGFVGKWEEREREGER